MLRVFQFLFALVLIFNLSGCGHDEVMADPEIEIRTPDGGGSGGGCGSQGCNEAPDSPKQEN